MNTEKNQIEKDQSANEARRSFLKMGAAVTPVLLSLASKPVFAMQGLSNMLSTTGSQAARHDCFNGGYSKGYWQNTSTHAADWITAIKNAGFFPINNINQATSITLDQAFAGHTLPSMVAPAQNSNSPQLLQLSATSSPTLLDVLTLGNSIPASHIVAGYLNLNLLGGREGGEGKYFLTTTQFWALNDGGALPAEIMGKSFPTYNETGAVTGSITVNNSSTLIQAAMHNVNKGTCVMPTN